MLDTLQKMQALTLCMRAETNATGADIHTVRSWTTIYGNACLRNRPKYIEAYGEALRKFIGGTPIREIPKPFVVG